MSDANPGQHAPSPPWPVNAPPFTPPAPPPPAPPPPGPDDSTRVADDPEALDGAGVPVREAPAEAGHTEDGRSAVQTGDRRSVRGLVPAGFKRARELAEQAEHLLERPGSLAAWSILLAVALYWLSSAIGGLAHGSTFRDTVTHAAAYSGLSARQRLDAIFGVGNYVVAIALLLALGLALLVPTKDERGGANTGGSPTLVRPGRQATLRHSGSGERASQRLLLVLTLAGVVVAFAALVMFITDFAHIGTEPDAALAGAVQDLAAIPVALVVALWAASRVT
ncbi:MAG: hypothetical protein J2O47_03005, partial [Acidimicrobiaceae bacterium]|nr:hypothetical protein [Acidimicrobiaceae bacterium]